MRRLTLLCALPIERVFLLRLGAPGVRVERVSAGPAAAGAGARQAVAAGAQALVSVGFCGAAADDLVPGDVIVATEVLGAVDGAVLECEPRLTEAVAARRGPLESRAHIARSPTERRSSRGIAIDMESAAIGAVAADAGLAFAAVRAVSDAATTRLPAAIADSGDLDLGALRPRDLPALLTLAVGAAKAGRALRGAAAAVARAPA